MKPRSPSNILGKETKFQNLGVLSRLFSLESEPSRNESNDSIDVALICFLFRPKNKETNRKKINLSIYVYLGTYISISMILWKIFPIMLLYYFLYHVITKLKNIHAKTRSHGVMNSDWQFYFLHYMIAVLLGGPQNETVRFLEGIFSPKFTITPSYRIGIQNWVLWYVKNIKNKGSNFDGFWVLSKN